MVLSRMPNKVEIEIIFQFEKLCPLCVSERKRVQLKRNCTCKKNETGSHSLMKAKSSLHHKSFEFVTFTQKLTFLVFRQNYHKMEKEGKTIQREEEGKTGKGKK